MSNGCISCKQSKRWHFQGCLTVGLAMGILSHGGQTASAQSGRSLEEPAKNGSGVKRATQRNSDFLRCLGARSRRLCAQIEPGWSFCIRVYDSARVSPGTLATAFSVAGHVLLAAGVPTEWHADSMEAENPEGRSCLILSVTRGMSRNAYPGALGFALPNTYGAADVTIFYDRIEWLEMRPVSGGASVSQILGYAMAHEIGHVLLGSREHPAEGIMGGPWKEAEFERLSEGRLGFTPRQSAVMRQSAFRRAVSHKGSSRPDATVARLISDLGPRTVRP